MPVTNSEPANQLERFREALRQAGVKLTHQRLEVFREVAASREHPDAETIFQAVRRRVPTISLDTVYRTLWLLLDLGLITALGPPRERARFDGNTQAHHHFLCVRCGSIHDFHDEVFDGLQPPAQLKALGTADKVHVEVRGTCAQCLRQAVGPVPEEERVAATA